MGDVFGRKLLFLAIYAEVAVRIIFFASLHRFGGVYVSWRSELAEKLCFPVVQPPWQMIPGDDTGTNSTFRLCLASHLHYVGFRPYTPSLSRVRVSSLVGNLLIIILAWSKCLLFPFIKTSLIWFLSPDLCYDDDFFYSCGCLCWFFVCLLDLFGSKGKGGSKSINLSRRSQSWVIWSHL